MNSPLGKYANLAAAFASIFVVVVNVIVHAAAGVFAGARSDPFLDNLTILAFGVLMGQVGAHTEAVQVAAAKINGMEADVKASQTRLDAIGAPPAAAVAPPAPEGPVHP